MVVKQRVSFRIGLGVSLALEDDVGGAGGAVPGDDVLADDLDLDVVVVYVGGHALGLGARGAHLGLDLLVLDFAVGSQDGSDGSGDGTSEVQLRISLGLGSGKGHGGHGSDGEQLEHVDGLEDAVLLDHYPRNGVELKWSPC